MYNTETIINTFQRLLIIKLNKRLKAVKNLKADASERRIFRLFTDENSVIGVYNDNAKENLAFINFTKTFIELGLNVPSITAVSSDNLFYIEEDLGDISLFKFSLNNGRDKLIPYYEQALADLVRFQTEAKDKIDYDYCYQTTKFDGNVLKYDAEKFEKYFLIKDDINNSKRNLLGSTVEILSAVSDKTDSDYFLYRDFQPRNIMIKGNELYYIDYQSGRKGPLQYDVASFLYSGSINLTEAERNSLLEFYLNELSKYIEFDRQDFKNKFYYFALMRLLQVIGSYFFLYETRNDESAKNKIPKALKNIKELSKNIDNEIILKFIESVTQLI